MQSYVIAFPSPARQSFMDFQTEGSANNVRQ